MPTESTPQCYTAFEGRHRIATGDLTEIALKTKEVFERGPRELVLLFDDVTGEQVELDFRGTVGDALNNLHGSKSSSMQSHDAGPRGPGRPKLGVVAREVTLLPRHWEWLRGQPGGASVALRKLVEQARRDNAASDRIRQAREAAYRFMSAMAGNLPGFEEAARALFAGGAGRFSELTEPWPADVRDYARKLAAPSFEG